MEDMKTEDFVMSAEQCPKLRLADSTVVRIEENPITGTATITLSYNQRQSQVSSFVFLVISRIVCTSKKNKYKRVLTLIN